MSRIFFASLLLLPLLTGCPAAGPGSTQNPTAQEKSVSPVDFGNGQTGSLSLTREGNQVKGELVVSNSAAALSVSAFSRSIQAGSYSLTGSFVPPKGFSVTGSFPPPIGAFSVSGSLPTQTEAGSATLTAGGETTSIVIPALNTIPSPTASTSPAASTSPVPSSSPAAISAKNWTEAELETIVNCFNANFNPKDPPSIGAYASGRSRLTAYITTKKDVSAEVHQSRLNTLGVDLIRLNHQYHFSCVNS